MVDVDALWGGTRMTKRLGFWGNWIFVSLPPMCVQIYEDIKWHRVVALMCNNRAGVLSACA